MTVGFPPQSIYPLGLDDDYTLFLVYNTAETTITSNNPAWSEEIPIKPRGADEEEIWADNGFATIEGELLYYDAVDKDSNNKVCNLKRCCRNIGGRQTQYNITGTWIRGFVIAEQHNQIVSAILNVEDFVGENFSTDHATLDWRIRNLQGQELIFDDFACPDVEFDLNVLSSDANIGTLVQYTVTLNGGIGSAVIQFGDGTSTTQVSGTHQYSPNATIDPVVIVTNGQCQIVQTPITRDGPDEPTVTPPPSPFAVPVPVNPIFPSFVFPSQVIPTFDVFIPPIIFPDINFDPIIAALPSIISALVPRIDLPSVITFVPPLNIPSVINLVPSIVLPSVITFLNVPSFSPIHFDPAPSFSPVGLNLNISVGFVEFGPAPSFSPILFGAAPSLPTIQFGPAPSFGTINFGPAPSFGPIGFGPAPSFGPIGFGPAPSFGPIGFGPAPSFGPIDFDVNLSLTIVDFGPAPSFGPIGFGPAPTFPDIQFGQPPIFSPIQFGPVPSLIVNFGPVPSLIVNFGPLPSLIVDFGPVPSFVPITFGPAPSFPQSITFGPAPSFAPITFGPVPSFMAITFGPAPSFGPIAFGPVPSFMAITFGPAPSFGPIGFGPAPSIPDIINFGPVPELIITFGPTPFFTPIGFGTPPSFGLINFGPAPSFGIISFGPAPSFGLINFGPAPSFAPILFGTPPTISVNWGTPPILSYTCAVSPMAMAQNVTSFGVNDPTFDPVELQYDMVGFPSEIKVTPPEIPPIVVSHDIPSFISVSVPEIKIDVPNEIKIILPDKDELINIISFSLPDKILLDASNVPGVISVVFPDKLPMISFDASSIPESIKVTGIPETIKIEHTIPSVIKVEVPSDMRVPLVFEGPPLTGELKVNWGFEKVMGEGKERPRCFAIVPCD